MGVSAWLIFKRYGCTDLLRLLLTMIVYIAYTIQYLVLKKSIISLLQSLRQVKRWELGDSRLLWFVCVSVLAFLRVAIVRSTIQASKKRLYILIGHQASLEQVLIYIMSLNRLRFYRSDFTAKQQTSQNNQRLTLEPNMRVTNITKSQNKKTAYRWMRKWRLPQTN